MSSWEHMGADAAALSPDRNGVQWVYLKRGVHLQPGDMVFEHMIERRRHVLVWRRLRSAIGLAWFRLRMWVRSRPTKRVYNWSSVTLSIGDKEIQSVKAISYKDPAP